MKNNEKVYYHFLSFVFFMNRNGGVTPLVNQEGKICKYDGR